MRIVLLFGSDGTNQGNDIELDSDFPDCQQSPCYTGKRCFKSVDPALSNVLSNIYLDPLGQWTRNHELQCQLHGDGT